jgi:hypothetical protein
LDFKTLYKFKVENRLYSSVATWNGRGKNTTRHTWRRENNPWKEGTNPTNLGILIFHLIQI